MAEYDRTLSLDTVYADTFDDPMLTNKNRQRNDLLNSADNPNPGVLRGVMPKKNQTLGGIRVERAQPVGRPASNSSR